MRLTKTESFLHKATRKAERNHDAKKLDPIQKYLIEHRIPTVREKEEHHHLFSTPNKIRVPDLKVTTWNIRLEHDTVCTHGELGFCNEKTLKRNTDYEVSGKPYTIVNADLAKALNLPENQLSLYLIFLEKEKQRAREESKIRLLELEYVNELNDK